MERLRKSIVWSTSTHVAPGVLVEDVLDDAHVDYLTSAIFNHRVAFHAVVVREITAQEVRGLLLVAGTTGVDLALNQITPVEGHATATFEVRTSDYWQERFYAPSHVESPEVELHALSDESLVRFSFEAVRWRGTEPRPWGSGIYPDPGAGLAFRVAALRKISGHVYFDVIQDREIVAAPISGGPPPVMGA